VGGALILSIIQLLLMAVWVLVLGRIVMSWIDPSGRNQLSAFLIRATEPILGPVRRMLPPSGMMDWSGFVVLIVLGILWRVL